MASIPLPALQIQQPQDPMQGISRMLALKGMLQQQKLFPLQIQAQQEQLKTAQLENQQRAYQMGATQALNKSYQNAIKQDANGVPQIDAKSISDYLSSSGYGSQIPGVLENINKFNKSYIDLKNSQADLQSKGNDLIGAAAAAVKAAGYNPQLAHTILDAFPPNPQIDQMRAKIDGDPQSFKQMVDSAIAQSPKQAEVSKNLAQTAQAQANTEKTTLETSQLKEFGGLTQAAADAKYRFLQQQKALGKQLAAPDAAFISAYEKQKTLAPIAQISVQNALNKGGNAAVANVPAHLVDKAVAAATKAGDDFAQAQSVSQRLAEMMADARKGNVVAYQLIPEEGALQVTTSQGVHRINMAEIQNYGGGSLWQRMMGHFGKALTGESIPSSVLDDMEQMQRIQQRGSRKKYENTLKGINQNYGSTFKPVDMDIQPPENTSQGGGAKGGPAIGTVEDGYKFKGGNPADPNSWEKVK